MQIQNKQLPLIYQTKRSGASSVKTGINKMNSSIERSFSELVNGNANGVCGTNNDIRAIVWEAFRAKYNVNVVISTDQGVTITLTACHSISGKSTSYHAGLTDEQYILINGSDFGLSQRKDAYISINGGVIEVHGGGKYFFKIANSNVHIKGGQGKN